MAIIRTNGFVQLRRGIQEHIANGAMSLNQLGIYTLIVMNADPASGVWSGSAGVLSAVAGQSPRTCRDAFETLEKSGYIKRFAVIGRHGSYPILVHRYECSDGAMKGMRLNAFETTDYALPKYFSRHEGVDDSGNDDVNERVNERAANNKIIREVENKDLSQATSPNPKTPCTEDCSVETRVRRCWEYFCHVTGKRISQYDFSPPRRAKGLRAFKSTVTYAIDLGLKNPQDAAEELFRAGIERLAASPWHNGNNPQRKKYLDWDHLLGDSKKPNRLIEEWLNENQNWDGE